MKIKKGEMYYFLVGDRAQWGKVYDVDENRIHCLSNQNMKEIIDVPVDSMSDFLTDAVHRRYSGEFVCLLSELNEYVECSDFFESIEDQVKTDWNGDLSKYLRYTFDMEICNWHHRKIPHPEYKSRSCEFHISSFDKSEIKFFIPHQLVFDKYPDLIIFGKICRTPNKKTWRRMLLDNILI
jgi:hypothetical protein